MPRKTDVILEYHKDRRNRTVLVASRQKGNLTTQNVIEALEREDIYGAWYVPLSFSGDIPEDLYDDGDAWALYDADDINDVLTEERFNAGYEAGQKDAEAYWQRVLREHGWEL